MRTPILSIITGLAVGVALLGPLSTETSKTSSSGSIPQPSGHDFTHVRETLPDHTESAVASHSDSNSQSNKVYLNQNVIDGKSTIICTRDTALRNIMTRGVARWNNALRASLGFNPFTIVQNATCAGVDIEVVQDQANIVYCGKTFDNQTGIGTWACYLNTKTPSPPRRHFRTVMPAATSGLRDRAVIVYQALDAAQHSPTDPIHIGTMTHELGHALGLSHYESTSTVDRCDALRTVAVDPGRDDYTVMTGRKADCSPGSIITGRDLRDFYEAYHVGAITNVEVTGNVKRVTTGAGRTRSRYWQTRFAWDENGVVETSHNASRIAVLAQINSSSSWRLLGHMPIRDSSGTPYRRINVRDTNSSLAAMYKVVGLTRGDIRLFGTNFDPAVSISGVNYVEGDPTFVVGVEQYNYNKNRGTAPEVLSASISPRHCFTNQTLTIHTYAASGPGSNSSSVSCGAQAGLKTFTASAQWGSDVNAVRRQISLPAQVRERIPAVSVGLTNVPASCTPGSSFTVNWSASGGDAGLKVWVNDTEVSSSGTPASGARSIQCLSPLRTRVRAVALVADGSGNHQSETVAAALNQPTGLTTVMSKPTLTGMDVTLAWNAVAQAAEYQVKACSGCTGFSPNGANGLSHLFSGLIRDHTHTLYVRAKHPDTAWTQWSSTSVSIPAALEAPTGLNVSVTSNSATLSWSAVAGATSYDVTACVGTSTNCTSVTVTPNIDLLTGQSLLATQYLFTSLTPDTQYRFTVKARNGDDVSPLSIAPARTARALPTPPLAPNGLSVSSVTPTGATLSWNAAARATSYSVQACPSASPSNCKSATVTGTSHPFTGLTPDTLYTFTVIAKNSGGSSQAATFRQSTSRALPAAPNTPTGLSVTGITSTSARLSWSATARAASYSVQACVSATGRGCKSATVTGTSYPFTGLTPATRYRFTVIAKNSGGSSGQAAAWATTSAAPAPTPTTSFTVTGKISARLLSSGAIEMAFTPSRESMRRPTNRYLRPATATTGKWYQSSVVVNSMSRTLGNISARFVGTGTSRHLEVCFIPHGRTRVCPSSNEFHYQRSSVRRDSWYWTDLHTYTVSTTTRPSGASANNDGLMEAGTPGAEDPVGEDGGLMADLMTPQQDDSDTDAEDE